MLRFIDQKEAPKVWDELVLLMNDYTFYQSYSYSQIQKINLLDVEFTYSKDNNEKINMMAYIGIKADKVVIPFGPIVSNDVSFEEIIEFIMEIQKHYNKSVVFSLTGDYISLLENAKDDIQKIWYFITPLIDTTKTIDEIFNNFNENRRRIIKKTLLSIPDSEIESNKKYGEEFFDLYKKRLIETKGEIDFSSEYLQNLLTCPNTQLIVCKKENKIISGIVSFKFGNTIINRYNCFDSAFSKISPTARLDYELLKQAANDPNIKYYDMSGLAFEDEATEKGLNVNRYKNSYRPSKILQYQWCKYR